VLLVLQNVLAFLTAVLYMRSKGGDPMEGAFVAALPFVTLAFLIMLSIMGNKHVYVALGLVMFVAEVIYFAYGGGESRQC
jgi:hypothetical protein